MSDAIWFVLKGHEEEGPFTPDQLNNMLRGGQITNAQELRRKGDVKRYTVQQALALKRQIQHNKVAEHIPVSTMGNIVQSTAFRAFLLFMLLIAVAAAALYFTGLYEKEPWSEWLKYIGIGKE